MSGCMTPDAFEIDPYMHAGSAIGNAFFSGLTLAEVYSCARLAETVEGFDEAVSATIKLKELHMSIEPTCHFCNASDKGRCRSQEEADTCHTYIEKERILKPAELPKKRPPGKISLDMPVATGQYETISIKSHAGNDADMISIYQNGRVVNLSTEDVDALIDNLNTVLQHLQQGNRK